MGGWNPGRIECARGRSSRPLAILPPAGQALSIAIAILAIAGCAHGKAVSWQGDLFVSSNPPYSVESPGAKWRSVSVPGSDLSLVGPTGSRMSLSSRCNAPLASVEILARHLRFSIGPHRLLESRAIEEAGVQAWLQYFDAAALRLKTVTTIRARCVYDWVLVARPEQFEPAEASFDRWRASFRGGTQGDGVRVSHDE